MLNDKDIQMMKEGIKRKEPMLTDEERKTLWTRIVDKSHQSNRTIKTWHNVWRAAAVILLLIGMGGTLLFYQHRPHADVLPDIATEQLKRITLYASEQHYELDNRAKVRHLAREHVLEVMLNGGTVRLPCGEDGLWQIAVPLHQTATVILTDGTEVRLGGGSLLKPKLHKKKVRSAAVEGEALFRVVSDSLHPFVTQAGDLMVKVMGTEFLVDARKGAPRQSVGLLKGRVTVAPSNMPAQHLKPGEALVYMPDAGKSIRTYAHENELPEWAEDLLTLDGMSLTDLLITIERRYGVRLSYSITALRDIHLEGKLDMAVPIEELLKRLSHIAPIRIEKRDREYDITLH